MFGSVWRHNKTGKCGLVLGIERHTETGEEMVSYLALYPPYQRWARPALMWDDPVEIPEGSCVDSGINHIVLYRDNMRISVASRFTRISVWEGIKYIFTARRKHSE